MPWSNTKVYPGFFGYRGQIHLAIPLVGHVRLQRLRVPLPGPFLELQVGLDVGPVVSKSISHRTNNLVHRRCPIFVVQWQSSLFVLVVADSLGKKWHCELIILPAWLRRGWLAPILVCLGIGFLDERAGNLVELALLENWLASFFAELMLVAVYCQ